MLEAWTHGGVFSLLLSKRKTHEFTILSVCPSVPEITSESISRFI
jgi:hypothetical protein